MLPDLLKKALQFFSGMSNDAKLLLVVMLMIVLHTNIANMGIVESLLERERIEKMEAERYTEKVTPTIKSELRYILMSDTDASNVILLNYHNNNHSSQGFSYKYITYLTEEVKDEERMHEEDFKELSYISYEEEFNKIHNSKYLKVDSLGEIKSTYPKLYRKLRNCDAKGAAFLPINGVSQPTGMIVILYKHEVPNYKLGFYARSFSSGTQRLAIILDYYRFKEELSK